MPLTKGTGYGNGNGPRYAQGRAAYYIPPLSAVLTEKGVELVIHIGEYILHGNGGYLNWHALDEESKGNRGLSFIQRKHLRRKTW